MSRKDGLLGVAAMFTPGTLLALLLLWPFVTALILLSLLFFGSLYLALFVWPKWDEEGW